MCYDIMLSGSVSSKGMVTGQTKQLMLSNLSLAKTKMPSMMSGMGGGLPTVRRVEVPSTVREDDEDDEETVTLTPDEVESTKPDIGNTFINLKFFLHFDNFKCLYT